MDELFADSPLKAAYAWSLLCHSRGFDLVFGPESLFAFQPKFRAEKFKYGRLFPSTSCSRGGPMVDPRELEEKTLYVVTKESDSGSNALAECKVVMTKSLKMGDITSNDDQAHHNKGDFAKTVSHPLCDIFFRTDDGELVMIDATQGKDAMDKTRKLNKWMDCNPTAVIGVRPIGIVLAPNIPEESVMQGSVFDIQGKDAIGLLGGLVQFRRWFCVGLDVE